MGPDTAPSQGCYTTGLWTGTQLRWLPLLAARLISDAQRLGYGSVESKTLCEAMTALGQATFGTNKGIVRFEARAGARGRACLTGTTRPYTALPNPFTLGISALTHPGPGKVLGAKVPFPALEAAREECQARTLDEVLLCDDSGYIVEGSRSNLLIHDAKGAWLMPPLRRGAVAGVALHQLREGLHKVRERDLTPDDLRQAREIVLTNGVHGAFAVQLFESAGERRQLKQGPLLEAAMRVLAQTEATETRTMMGTQP